MHIGSEMVHDSDLGHYFYIIVHAENSRKSLELRDTDKEFKSNFNFSRILVMEYN